MNAHQLATLISNHRFLYVNGQMLSRSLTNNAIVCALAWYLTSSGDVGVMNSAILTNIQGSLSSIFEIFLAHAAGSFMGRFGTLMLSNIAGIMGLVLLWFFHPYYVRWVLVLAIILLALGTSGSKVLQDVFENFVHGVDTSHGQDKKRSIASATIWSCVIRAMGAVIAILWVAPDSIGGVYPTWGTSFLICFITSMLPLIIYEGGVIVSYLRKHTLEIFFGVFQMRLKKLLKCISRCLTRQDRSSQMDSHTEKREDEGMTRETSIDKKGKEEENNITCYKQDIMLVVKSLLRILPICGVFLVVSIISAAASAFFYLQYSNLNTDSVIAVQMYGLVQELSKFAIPYIYRWIWCLPINEKLKIGIGMFYGVSGCICAWQLEVRRLKEVKHANNTNTSINFLWLVPQFHFIGCMEGLTKEGLLEFCKSQLKEEQYLYRYREEYFALVRGIGEALNIFLILICKCWFGDTINNSRLDKYYMVLICMGSANFITYCCFARFFYKDQVSAANDDPKFDIENLQKDRLTEQICDIVQNQYLANDDHEQDINQEMAEDDQKQADKQMAMDLKSS